jgi:hypothetical protein
MREFTILHGEHVECEANMIKARMVWVAICQALGDGSPAFHVVFCESVDVDLNGHILPSTLPFRASER